MSEEMQVYKEKPYLTAIEVRTQINLIQEILQSCLISGEHYGVIPGCGSKPALLKAGAEKLAMTFRLAPKFDVTVIDMPNGHREYRVVTSLSHILTGAFLGEGLGSCSTMESKYRYRKGEQTCPICGMPTIIKGKKEYGGGWLCYSRKGGCGAKFDDDDPAIANQDMGRIEYPDPADYYNTCLKMSKKRSLVDAILTATAASDIFEQDIEENPPLFEQEPGSTVKVKAEEERIQVQEIKSMLMQMAHGEKTEFLNLLKTVSLYRAKDKKEYWASSIEDLHKREGWIKKVHILTTEKYSAWACEERGTKEPEPKQETPEGDSPDIQAQRIKEIDTWLLEMAGGSESEYKDMLKQVSSFTGKDGNEVFAGNLDALKGKIRWVNKVHHVTREMYEAWVTAKKSAIKMPPDELTSKLGF